MRKVLGASLPILSIALAFTLCAVTLAQVQYGAIEGFVADDEGNAIAGAAVTVSGPQGVRSSITGKNGRFSFRDLIPGSYQVKAEAQNYATVVQTDVKVVVGKTTQVPFALAAGMTEQLTVISQAPIVDMKATTTGATVSVSEFAEYVPLGRNFTAMLQLAPGVVSSGPYTANNGNFSMSGSSGLENLGRCEEALADLQRNAGLDPTLCASHREFVMVQAVSFMPSCESFVDREVLLQRGRRAVELAKRNELGGAKGALGMALYHNGRYEEARPVLKEAVSLQQQKLDRIPDEFNISYAHFFLAMTHRQLGQREAARTEYRRALAGVEHINGGKSPDLVWLTREAGALLGEQT